MLRFVAIILILTAGTSALAGEKIKEPSAKGGGDFKVTPAPSLLPGTIPEGGERPDVQSALWDWGFDSDPSNPAWDATDAAAMSAWQRDWQRPETGVPTAEEAEMVLRTHPRTKSHFFPSDKGCTAFDHFPQARTTMTWSGGCIDGKTEGYGKLIWLYWFNGQQLSERYEGTMRAGLQHGQGVLEFENGDKYIGNQVDGNFEGTGSMIYADGQN
ncbi:MAG: hypothetical protein AAF439_13455, partial [Pseudomonadota bacterium]